jgi:hypothetical protein
VDKNIIIFWFANSNTCNFLILFYTGFSFDLHKFHSIVESAQSIIPLLSKLWVGYANSWVDRLTKFINFFNKII